MAGLYALDLKDGPFPEHYEPMESPARNLLSKVQNNPAGEGARANVSSDLRSSSRSSAPPTA